MSALLEFVFVLTCDLLIPLPNPGLGYRAAEKPDPLLCPPPPAALAIALSFPQVAPWLQWENKGGGRSVMKIDRLNPKLMEHLDCLHAG